MDTQKVITYIGVFLTLSLSTTNGQKYTYTKNVIVKQVYDIIGYDPSNGNDIPDRWTAEGVAIYNALKYIDTLEQGVFSTDGGIELIVGSTGWSTAGYICGLTKRIIDVETPIDQIPSEIIIVYTLNYFSSLRATEYEYFKEIVKTLIDVASNHTTKRIKVVVKNYRPISKEDYDFGKKTDDLANQIADIINDHIWLDTAVHQGINTKAFISLLKNVNINKIVDGVAGCGVVRATNSNKLHLAIRYAQINVLSEAVVAHKKRVAGEGGVIVICSDNPSGMDEEGNWTTGKAFPVDYILSYVWHKELVNSGNFIGNPRAIVLDIWFKEKRLLLELYILMTKQRDRYAPLLIEDVDKSFKVKKGVITFKANGTRMVVDRNYKNVSANNPSQTIAPVSNK